MTPLDQKQVVQTAQIVLAYLGNPENSTPNDMLEGIVSGKSLLRGIISGSLVVCQPAAGKVSQKKPAAKVKAKRKDKKTAPKKAD